MSEDFDYIEKIAGLIIRYHNEALSEDELLELRVWCAQSQANQALFERLSDPEFVKGKIRELPDIKSLKEAGWQQVRAVIEAEDPDVGAASMIPVSVKHIKWTRYFMAASIAGVLAIGAWLYIKNLSLSKTKTSPVLASNIKNDVAPGGNKAILTLADGSRLTLDSVGNGTIAQQGNMVVKKNVGALAYSSTSLHEKTGAVVYEQLAYNTLTTPAAGQFQLSLPDGSKVWLNNASSLRYPVAFTGKTREVELQGEAYFEVAKNSTQPFKVKVGGVTVNVLGTSFNIAAYSNENMIRTTLLTGGVGVSRGLSEAVVLKPGEQAQAAPAGSLKTVKDIDTDGVVAWKNGLFHFEKADIQTVMRQLARWYDVDVVYEGNITGRLFGGDIQRNLNLSQVLEILQKNQVHFDLEGRRITVRP